MVIDVSLLKRSFYLGIFILIFFLSVSVKGEVLVNPPKDFCHDMQGNIIEGGADLDGDGICDCKDSCQVCILGVFKNGACKLSRDKDENGEIDECEQYWKSDLTQGPKFMRGDSNGDQKIDVSDVIFSLQFLFLGQNNLRCEDAADINDNGKIDLSDAIYILNFLFKGGDPPVVWPEHFFDGIVDGRRCASFLTRDECIQGEYRSFECIWNELDLLDDLERGSCEPRFREDAWKKGFSQHPFWCDIYPQESSDSEGNTVYIRDSLTCNNYILPESEPLPIQEEKCDVEREDENKNGISNEGCKELPPDLRVIAPPLIFITLNQHDHGFKLYEVTNQRKIKDISIKLVSGVDNTEYDLPRGLGAGVTGARDMFTLLPSVSELNERGVADASISGWQSLWDSFYQWQKSIGEKFPPIKLGKIIDKTVKHKIKITVKDENNLESSAFVNFIYQVDIGDENNPQYAIPTDGSFDDDGLNFEGDCSCSDIKVYLTPVQCDQDGSNCQNQQPPFPWPRSSSLEGFYLFEEFIPFGDHGSAMEVLGEEDKLQKRDSWFDPWYFGLGPVFGVFPLKEGLASKTDSPNRDFYKLWTAGPRFQGFHYQVEVDAQGLCSIGEYIQSSILKKNEVKHLTCTGDGINTAVEYNYLPVVDLQNGDGHAGFFGPAYSCSDGFSSIEKDSPFYGYTLNSPIGMYYESEVKKITSGKAAWQNTFTSLRSADANLGIKLYRIADIVTGSNGAVCGCSFELVSDKTGWRVLRDPQCSVFVQG